MLRHISLNILFFVLVLSFLAGCVTSENRSMTSPSKESTAPVTNKAKVYHKVLRGQTLWQIAQGYGVSIKDIIDSNNIPNGSALEVGQLLYIPGAQKVTDISKHIVDYNKNELDIQAQAGDNVQAVREGDVVLADYISGYGQTVMIDHRDGFISVYARNTNLLVKLGDHVYKGDTIAQVGQMGNRVVEHFEIRHGSQAANPLYYLP